MEKYHAIAEILWESPEQIQQKLDTGQSVYALNISFDGIGGLWSVVTILEDLNREDVRLKQPQMVKIGFMFPENVKGFLKIGMHFILSEGPSDIIGTGKILVIKNM